MKPMKKLTDKKKLLRLTLQSLPIALAAIVFFIYASTFMPLSAERMGRSVALVESVSHYELLADGKPVAFFSNISDSLQPEGLSPSAGQDVAVKTYATACWVNRWPLLPSCNGMLLTANSDSAAEKRLAAANRKMPEIIRKAIEYTRTRVELLDRTIEETGYYMKTHNVNDDGYNTIAEYAAGLEQRKAKAEKLLSALTAASKRRQTAIRLVTEYTVISKDTAGKTLRTPCSVLTPDRTKPLRLLQTADRTTPTGAIPLYLHQWMTPQLDRGDGIATAAYPGCQLSGYRPDKARTQVSDGNVAGKDSIDVPPVLAPDGSPVFTSYGRLAGISIGGKVAKPGVAGFGLNNLLP